MTERDWDHDFDRPAWQALSASAKAAWIERAWRREHEGAIANAAIEDMSYERRRRYERGQTVWDIGLDPQPFDTTLAEAVGEVKDELFEGVVFGDEDLRDRVLSALLANAGLRRAVRLVPVQLWRQAISGDAPIPVVRPEFVPRPEEHGIAIWRVRHYLAQPFYRLDLGGRPSETGDWATRVMPVGHLDMGGRSLPRPDLIITRHGWRGSHWPAPAETLLLVEISANSGDLLLDWQIRRPAYLDAGAEEVWVLDCSRRRILRQRRGDEPTETRFSAHDGQSSIVFRPDVEQAGDPNPWPAEGVTVTLTQLFDAPVAPAETTDGSAIGDFDNWQRGEQARLQRFETAWVIGFAPQPFHVSLGELLGRFKDELWQGCLFGPEHRRDEILAALLANAGLRRTLRLAPRDLWQQALEDHRDRGANPIV
jgi:hypothetical protein